VANFSTPDPDSYAYYQVVFVVVDRAL